MAVAPDIVASGTLLDAGFWLNAAQASVRRYCGWHVAPSLAETVTVDAYGGRTLLLRTKHLTDLASVLVDGEDITSRVRWSQAGVLTLRAGSWPDDVGAVTVTLTHGYAVDEVSDLAAMIATIAKRASSQPGIVASQSVNGASVSFLTAGGAPLSVPLLGIEKEALDPYRLNWGVEL
jgi:hypothetical protein